MPPTYVTPGVYVAETPSAPASIAPAPTSCVAFIGAATRGVSSKAFLVRSFEEFTARFGPLRLDLDLGYALHQFFLNGGHEAWVIRIARDATTDQWERAISALDVIPTLNLIALPAVDPRKAIKLALPYAQRRRALLLVDAPRAATSISEIIAARNELGNPPDAALYFPWVEIEDPLSPGRPRLSAPSGSIAGLYAQFDGARGVWKAPAGLDATLDHVIRPVPNLNDLEQGQINPLGINCIRYFAGQPPRVVAWGARTLAGSDQQSSEWKYVSVRRTALFIMQSLEAGFAWVTFEPNTEALWARLRTLAENFLTTLFRQGAFQGTTPQESFFVQCGPDTTSPTDHAAGRMNLLIGFAPTKPSEFILLKFSFAAAQPA